MGGWEAYTEKMEKEGCYKAAILGHNGKAWAHTKGFKVHADEVSHIVDVLQGDSFEPFYSGVTVAGKPYAFIRGDFNFEDAYDLTWCIGRHKHRGKLSEGIIIALTDRAVVIGIYNAAFTSNSFGSALLKTSRMAQLMIQQGY
mmetsp:Transcript_1333/g.4022  ORF Transcript_1333/g.4022 Transcript_1333/m.4022 type:complete len:143 (-) Transcript_1333:741-1169(-)|eukprot:CAMPEP_0198723032 /NCGR_PEP_ID=MMETSP1475-20131203/591_1 /TAXON_ID= ORGANISM="Unidentified sp., Strain CCMP1999" /NCGR_SAMPLE_ID=MMETSP1475 /ASSEMBLY_ACC=CAM_ASM_001111 /LENGTH=142 /DNA_ID=CAMNT_0044484013 /DNA_START=304 /DNA_END=732 /DNA_ORIENTATION=+